MHLVPRIFWLACVSVAFLHLACSSSGIGGTTSGNFSISGSFPHCQMDSIHLYTIEGMEFKKLFSSPIQKGQQANFTLAGNLEHEGFYLLGKAPNNLMGIVLGKEKGIQLSGNCMNLRSFGKIENSTLNDSFEDYQKQMTDLTQSLNALARQAQAPGAAAVREQMNQIFEQQKALVEQANTVNPVIGRILALSVFKPFDPTTDQVYKSSLDHFAAAIFPIADFSAGAYDNVLPITDNMRMYVQTIFQKNSPMPDETATYYLKAQLDRIPANTKAHRNAMAAAVDQLEKLGSPAFITFAQQYLANYSVRSEIQESLNRRMEMLKVEAERQKLFSVGGTPPDLAYPTPDGDVFKLSSLRGKVVLLDFWASWCRPCRMENPNVVRAYQKYKNKGFDILSVSLDRNRASWLKAIEADNMTWHHISDLKYWQSDAAKTYQVSSIPATFLLNKDGSIIAKNLRGPALDRKLAEIFSES